MPAVAQATRQASRRRFLGNRCIRLGRGFEWDPQAEQIVGDDAANAWLRRDQRKGFEIVV